MATENELGDERLILPLAEEHAVVSKEMVVTGRVKVQAVTDEIAHSIREDLAGEKISIERVRHDRTIEPGDAVPQQRIEGDVTIIPVLEEILVVEKRLVLREEIHLTRTPTNEHIEQPVILRKQRVVVDRTRDDVEPIKSE
jgi:stress response protein YsnF